MKVSVNWRYDDFKRDNPLIDFNDFNIKSLMELICNVLKNTYTKGNQIPNYYVSLYPKSEMINTYNLSVEENRKGFWNDDTYYDFYDKVILKQIKSMGDDYCKFWLRGIKEKNEINGWVEKNWEFLTKE